jgi:hypothetical protein
MSEMVLATASGLGWAMELVVAVWALESVEESEEGWAWAWEWAWELEPETELANGQPTLGIS